MIELDGVLQKANVIEVDDILAKIHFQHIKRFEWIYCGSPRISDVYRSSIKSKSLDDIIQFKKFNATLNADADVVLIELPIKPNDHVCSPECVRQRESNVNALEFKRSCVLRHPEMTGWTNDKGILKTPCGITVHNLNEIQIYLDKTKSKLNINCFQEPRNSIGKDILIIEVSLFQIHCLFKHLNFWFFTGSIARTRRKADHGARQ